MSVSSLMVITSIVTQTPMASVFGGQDACHIFWIANMVYSLKLVTSGTGMAIYRLVCFNNLFKRHLDTKRMARKVIIVEWIVIFGVTLMKAFSMVGGWEKAFIHRYCMNIGQTYAQTLHDFNNSKESNDILNKIIRLFPNVLFLIMILVQFFIYLKILYQLWKHDVMNTRNNVITENVRKERHKKNVITLRGQVVTFAIEFFYAIIMMIYNSKNSFVDPSRIVIDKIIGSTVISLVQLLTSHEMKRFLKDRCRLF